MREAALRGFFLGSKAPFGYRRVKVNDGVKERPTLEVVEAELGDVRKRLERLYEALETSELTLEALSPRIFSLRHREEQLEAARDDAETQLEQRAGWSFPTPRRSQSTWQTSGTSCGKGRSRSARRSPATSWRASRWWETRRP